MREPESKKSPVLAHISSSANEETKEARAERPRFHSSSTKTRLPPRKACAPRDPALVIGAVEV